MANIHGKFVWYELMTSDTAAAASFYSQVVGWTAKDSGMPGMNYTILSMGESGVGGLMAVPEPARAMGVGPRWTGYVAVDDVDASAKKVTELGGRVHRAPDEIPGVGRFAVVADPDGATFELFKPSQEMPDRPQPPAGAQGQAGWRELYAGDGAAAFTFYSKLFGWTKGEAIDMGPMGKYQIFACGGEMAGGMMTKPPQIPSPTWLYYFNVNDINAAKARVEAAGGRVVNGPMEVPGGSWILQGIDPQGAMFALVEPRG